MGSKFASRIDGGEDACVGAVTDDGAEFPAAGINKAATHQGKVIRAVVTEVGSNGSSSEVDMIAYDGVTHVAQMPDGRVMANDRVFDFDRLADMAVVADGSGSTQVAVGADLAMLPDDDVALDDHTGKNARALTKLYDAIDMSSRADISVISLLGEL